MMRQPILLFLKQKASFNMKFNNYAYNSLIELTINLKISFRNSQYLSLSFIYLIHSYMIGVFRYDQLINVLKF